MSTPAIEDLAGILPNQPRLASRDVPRTMKEKTASESKKKRKKHDDRADESSDASDACSAAQIAPLVTSRRRLASDRPVGYDIPGSQSVFMRTQGCSHNISDSEYMMGLLVEQGYGMTSSFEDADIYILNSCTVKNPSEMSFINMVRHARQTGRPVIVAGCVPQGDPNSDEWSHVSVIGVQQIHRIVEVVVEALRGNQVRLLGRSRKERPSLDMPKIRRNRWVEIIPINTGCLNQCTYCKTKHARGDLRSWPIEEIVQRVRLAVDEGVLEIRITSEDTGAYGIDLGITIVDLLDAITDVLAGTNVMLRVGMTNPPYILAHLDEIGRILRHPNVYEFLHVPVQAASDRVLDVMKREYTCADFVRVVESLRRSVPNISLTTDIICGFPTETDEEFEETMELVRQYRFEGLNISQFYPRPGTPAMRMKLCNTKVVKSRSRAITQVFKAYGDCHAHLVGTRQRVWITEIASDDIHLAGHTKAYVQVLIDPEEAQLGDVVEVNVTKSEKFCVFGTVIRTNETGGGEMSGERRSAKQTTVAPSDRSGFGRHKYTKSTSSLGSLLARLPLRVTRQDLLVVSILVSLFVAFLFFRPSTTSV